MCQLEQEPINRLGEEGWRALHAGMSTGNGVIRGVFGRRQRVGTLARSHGTLKQRRAGKDAALDDWYSNYQFQDESAMQMMLPRQSNGGAIPISLADEAVPCAVTCAHGRKGTNEDGIKRWREVCAHLR